MSADPGKAAAAPKFDIAESPDLEGGLRIFTSIGHVAKMGLVATGHGSGWITYLLPWRKDLTSDTTSDVIDNAVIYSTLDSACALATWAKAGHFRGYPTLDFRVDFVRRPTPRTDLIVRGECYALDADYAFMRAIAHEGDPDDPVATGSGTFMSFSREAYRK